MRRAFTIIGAAVLLITTSTPSFSDILSVETVTTYYLNRPSQPGDFAIISAYLPFLNVLSGGAPPTTIDGSEFFSFMFEEDAQYTVTSIGSGLGAVDSGRLFEQYGISPTEGPFEQEIFRDFGGPNYINLGLYAGVTGLVVDESLTVSLTCVNTDCSISGVVLPNDFVSVGLSYSLTAPVPEPSTWAMLLIGLAGIGFVAYRRRGSIVAYPPMM